MEKVLEYADPAVLPSTASVTMRTIQLTSTTARRWKHQRAREVTR
jgi:hypothetical protein